MLIKLDSNSQTSACLCLPTDGIKGMCHQPRLSLFSLHPFIDSLVCWCGCSVMGLEWIMKPGGQGHVLGDVSESTRPCLAEQTAVSLGSFVMRRRQDTAERGCAVVMGTCSVTTQANVLNPDLPQRSLLSRSFFSLLCQWGEKRLAPLWNPWLNLCRPPSHFILDPSLVCLSEFGRPR